MAPESEHGSLLGWFVKPREPVYASAQLPTADFPASYHLKRQRACRDHTPAGAPAATPQTPAALPPPHADHQHHVCHWHPGMYTMAFLHKVKGLGQGLGRIWTGKCCSCCTCPGCKTQAVAAPQSPEGARPLPALQSASAQPASQPPLPAASLPPDPSRPGDSGKILNLSQVFPDGDPVARSPAVRLARTPLPNNLSQDGQVGQAVLAQELDESPER
jgi:hypothetical protein